MPTPDRKPDAVIVGRPYLPAGTDLPHAMLSREFGPLLNLGPRGLLYVRAQGDQYFCSGSPDDSLVYPSAHPLAPAERYEWHVVNEGGGAQDLKRPRKVGSWTTEPGAVKFGWLKPDPYLIAAGQPGPSPEELAASRLKRFGGGPAYPPGHVHEIDPADAADPENIKAEAIEAKAEDAKEDKIIG